MKQSNGAFKGAIVGAALAFVVGTLTDFYADYLTRRDGHVQQARKCKELALTLATIASYASEAAQSDANSVAAPIPSGRSSNKFVLPPIDEIIHSQDQFSEVLGPKSRDAVLRLESNYRSLRDDLSHTPGIYHTGETFGIPPSSGDEGMYEHVLTALSQEAEGTTHILNASDHCRILAHTSFF